MSAFLKNIFSWTIPIIDAFSAFAEWAQGPIISNEHIRDFFDEFSYVFDIPNKILMDVLGLKPMWEMSLIELVIPGVLAVVIYTLLKWLLGIVTGS